jgi:hypothetical protein
LNKEGVFCEKWGLGGQTCRLFNVIKMKRWNEFDSDNDYSPNQNSKNIDVETDNSY